MYIFVDVCMLDYTQDATMSCAGITHTRIPVSNSSIECPSKLKFLIDETVTETSTFDTSVCKLLQLSACV